MPRMKLKSLWTRLRQNPAVRIALLVLGVLFLAITPLLGPLPGPGGIFTFAIGLGLVLRNSLWARRRYVRFKRKRPTMGRWADKGLRRNSARRREMRSRAQRTPAD
jgi:O-antigen/teichoic acid export membrane protein